MRTRTPTIHCDAEEGGYDDGGCEEWAVDYYEACASSVGGVRITAASRAPGWRSLATGEDFCPEHAEGAGAC